ncbi:sensor histidine kinase [Paenibacillus sp. FSL H7-0323]|uniref:sensor histidine kinase n=1 Tax=Paenibacillus sp. FSL H7-0323 TaxID=2921433 RepID=UPI0030F81099
MAERAKFRLFPQKQGFFPFVWAVYLVLPILNLRGETGMKLILGGIMIAVFAISYRQLYWVRGGVFNVWLFIQMLIIVVLSVFYTPYNLYMGFFTANFIAYYTENKGFKIAFASFVIMILSVLVLVGREMEWGSVMFLAPFIIIMLISPFGVRSMNRNQKLEKELDQANEVIKELVKREERMRIARDLHDTLGHTLSLITLKSQLVEKLVTKNTERAQEEAREIQRTSRAALRQVRELVSEMRAVSVAEELAEAGEMLRTAEIALEVEGDISLEGVSDLTQNILSLCIKEAVTNIVKHSRADKCFIGVAKLAGEVRITVKDNGIGLQHGERGNGGLSDGNGMKGMAERLSLIDGSLSLSSAEGQGATLIVTIPLIVKDAQGGETA